MDSSPAFTEDEEVEIEKLQDMLVLHGRTLPSGALDYNQVFDLWRRRMKERTAAATDPAAARELLEMTLHARFPNAVESQTTGDHMLLHRTGSGDEVPAVFVSGHGTPAVLVHPSGIAGARTSPALARLREAGRPVLLIDAFQTGTAIAPRDRSAAHFLTFNVTDDAARVQDILTAVAYLRQQANGPVEIIGVDGAAVWALFAAAVSPPGVIHSPDIGGFAGSDDEYIRNFFVPGIQSAGGIAAALRLVSARPVAGARQ